MPGDLPWLNLSSRPAALGNACAAGAGQLLQHHGQFSAGLSVLLAALMGLLVLATVLGNALVILAFVVDRSLRTQGNFFFLNLALADLLVGEFCAGGAPAGAGPRDRLRGAGWLGRPGAGPGPRWDPRAMRSAQREPVPGRCSRGRERSRDGAGSGAARCPAGSVLRLSPSG